MVETFKKKFYVLIHLHLPKHQGLYFHSFQVIIKCWVITGLFFGGKVGALNILINFFFGIKNCNILIITFSFTFLFTFTIL